jgi:signal transduction histidine kinase/CHASE1-domain containing sensor protein
MGRHDMFGMPKSRLVPWVVLALGLTTTAGLYFTVVNALRQRNSDKFDEEIVLLNREIGSIIDSQVGVLYAAAGAVSANSDMNRDEFRSFYVNLRKGKAASVLTSVGFSVQRPWAQRNELVEEAVRRGVTDFRLNPDTPRPQVLATLLLEPRENISPDSFGHDMSLDLIRGDAIKKARRTQLPRMTSKVVLSRDRKTPAAAFLIYLPVVDEKAPSKEIGLVHIGLRSRGLFEPLVKILAKDRVGIRLWSGSQRPEVVLDVLSKETPGQHRTARIDLPQVGQTLLAEYVSLPGFESPGVIQPYVLPVGSLLSLLLFALSSFLGRAQEGSEQREAYQKLLADAGRLTSNAAEDDELLGEIAAAIGATFDAVCRIDLLEEDQTLRSVSTRKERNEALEALEREYPRLQSDLLLNAALKTGQTQRSNSGYLPTDEKHRERIEAMGLGPIAVVPMKIRDRKVGAITLARPRGQSDFSQDMIVLTEAIAVRVALAIDNARLYRAAQGEIRESRTAESEARRMNDELERRVVERTRDLEASTHELESFCYSVSHDLRTPLRSLDGFSRALKEDYGDRLDEQGHDFLDRIRAAAKRMDELITALLTLSRLTRTEILPVAVDVTRMARDLAQDLDPDGKVEFKIEDGLSVHADPRMVEVMVENLLSNAVKFSSRAEAPCVEVGETPDGWLYVRDNGAGFDPQYSNKLFQPFERLHSVREFPGHGIGLATVARIVRRHAGEFKAEGRPGKGAAIYVRLPKPNAATAGP